jgi:hypothetical protein
MKIFNFLIFLWVIFALLDQIRIQQLKLMRICIRNPGVKMNHNTSGAYKKKNIQNVPCGAEQHSLFRSKTCTNVEWQNKTTYHIAPPHDILWYGGGSQNS